MSAEIEKIMKGLDSVEASLSAMSARADAEAKANGTASKETKDAIEAFGVKQREMADRLLALEQAGHAAPAEAKQEDTWGSQLIKSKSLEAYQRGETSKVRIEIKNTLIGDDATVAPDRKPGIIAGPSVPLTIEALLPALPTASNAIEFTRETAFTNSAAETAEGAAKPESALTWALVTMPVSTVAHWIKISKQLAADNATLAAYTNQRMTYGVNRRVETQLVIGNGTAPNISGIFDTGNFTAHGYADAALGTVLKKLVLIRKIMADSWSAGYPADAVLMNPVDWAQIEIDLLTTAAGQNRLSFDEAGNPRLFGVRVFQSIGVAADTFAVGAFAQAYTVYNRQNVVVELSDSDSDNFTKNLVTIRAERRLALATEIPGAVRGGDLSPL